MRSASSAPARSVIGVAASPVTPVSTYTAMRSTPTEPRRDWYSSAACPTRKRTVSRASSEVTASASPGRRNSVPAGAATVMPWSSAGVRRLAKRNAASRARSESSEKSNPTTIRYGFSGASAGMDWSFSAALLGARSAGRPSCTPRATWNSPQCDKMARSGCRFCTLLANSSPRRTPIEPPERGDMAQVVHSHSGMQANAVLRRPWPKATLYPVVGTLLALGAPTGLLLLRCVLGGRVSPRWISHEIAQDAVTYGYVTASTLLVFVVAGVILGRGADKLQAFAKTDSL